MIKYRLLCDSAHEFEGWFRDSADFDRQSDQALIECPSCGSSAVRKAVMAPAIARRGKPAGRAASIRADMAKAAARARDYVERNFDYVGERFPEEARKIHYGETAARGIYGEASGKDVKSLIDEGVQIAPLPAAPKPADKAGAPETPAVTPKKLN